MRVIAGKAGGLPLVRPPAGVRPTMDRVRGAIFSSLGDAVLDSRVLDLFAGSGAMGIEALSRGAQSAVFVDSNVRCIACIRQNLERSGLEAPVQALDALAFLRSYQGPEFDLVFADPPYVKRPGSHDAAAELLASPNLPRLLRANATLILERRTGCIAPETSWLKLVRVRRYGESEIAYFRAPE